jgi:glutamyl-tRNA reductase
MRGKFSLDTLAKHVYLNKQNRRNRELMLLLLVTELKYMDLLNNPFQLIKLICENSNGSVEEFQK